MERESRIYLEDIWTACDRIESLLLSDATLDRYLSDDRTRWAIERQLSIIGEAMYQLQQFFPATAAQFPDVRQIVKFRHVIIHGYQNLNDHVVWEILQRDLPILRNEIEKLLRE